ncbi:MAG: MvaI/BcnI family restriction endonuclease [Planctomycetota bacterium]
MDIDTFRQRFADIRRMGYVRSARRGPTGIGKTLEDLLGITENNISLPDLGEIELKAHRLNSSSMITLFTFNRKAWLMKPLDAVRQYGTTDNSGRLGLYFTMSRIANSSGLFLLIDDNAVSVRHISGQPVAEWNLSSLAEQFMKKLPALLFVSAQIEERAGTEWFHFQRAQLLSGTSVANIRDQIEIGNVKIDLRLHDKGTRARNHGTGFRISEANLPLLYSRTEDLL